MPMSDLTESKMAEMAQKGIERFVGQNPEYGHVKAEIPAPLKWAGGIAAALLVMGVASMAFWLVSSVSTMQITLARVDERQISQVTTQDGRQIENERWRAGMESRLTKLETLITPTK